VALVAPLRGCTGSRLVLLFGLLLGLRPPDSGAHLFAGARASARAAVYDALAKADVLDRCAALHVWAPLVTGSHDVICTHCRTGWPCTEAELMGLNR
jgi:hypothetical protein